MNNFDIRSLIIKTIKEDYKKKIPIYILIKKVKATNNWLKQYQINDVVNQMLQNEELVNIYNDVVVLGYINAPKDMSKKYTGTLHINSHGNGTIISIDENTKNEIKYFVHKKNILNALHNDVVCFVKLQKEPNPLNHQEEVAIIEVIKRNKHHVCAIVKNENGIIELIPYSNKFYLKIKFNQIKQFKNNDVLLLHIDKFNNDNVETSLIKIIGNQNDNNTDINTILDDNDVKVEFNNNIINEANNLKFQITDFDLKYRKDISNKIIVSIDPKTSKDMDDAICVEKKGDNYLLNVSIADVSSYIQMDSELDNEAIQRSTSIYYLNTVIPMLPFNLSDNLCSLNPYELKKCISCDMLFDSNGNLIKYDVYPSIIKSHAKLNYDEVNDYFNNGVKNNQYNSELYKLLDIANELHQKIRKNNIKNGYISFNIKEPKIIVDNNNKPIDVIIKQQGEAQKMIEDFMISANECVTLFANKNKIPFIYRIHNKPELKKYNNFLIETKKLNINLKFDYNSLNPLSLSNLLNENKININYEILNKIALGMMNKAKYSLDNIGHFGLALQNYTHFTSPIRRYADLIVHRLLWAYCFAPDFYNNEYKNKLHEKLNLIIEQCNINEQKQLNVEREINGYKFAEYMENKIGQIYDGYISAVLPFGFFVELENTVEGLVSIKQLDDFYEYNENTLSLVGKKTNNQFNIGQKVKIMVQSVNKELSQIDFKLINN